MLRIKRAPLSYSGPSASTACPLQSLLSPALNNPPIHVNSHLSEIGHLTTTPHTPFNSLRSLPYLKPSLSAGFRKVYIAVSIYIRKGLIQVVTPKAWKGRRTSVPECEGAQGLGSFFNFHEDQSSLVDNAPSFSCAALLKSAVPMQKRNSVRNLESCSLVAVGKQGSVFRQPLQLS